MMQPVFALTFSTEAGMTTASNQGSYASSELNAGEFSTGVYLDNENQVFTGHVEGNLHRYKYYAGSLQHSIHQGIFHSNGAWLPSFSSYGFSRPNGLSQGLQLDRFALQADVFTGSRMNVNKKNKDSELSQVYYAGYRLLHGKNLLISPGAGISSHESFKNRGQYFSELNLSLFNVNLQGLVKQNRDFAVTLQSHQKNFELQVLAFEIRMKEPLSSEIYKTYYRGLSVYLSYKNENKVSLLFTEKDYRAVTIARAWSMKIYTKLDTDEKFAGIAYVPGGQGIHPYFAVYHSLFDNGYLVSMGIQSYRKFGMSLVYSSPLAPASHIPDAIFWDDIQTNNLLNRSLYSRGTYYGLILGVNTSNVAVRFALLRLESKENSQGGVSFTKNL